MEFEFLNENASSIRTDHYQWRVKGEKELSKLTIFPLSKENEIVSSWSTFRGGLPHLLYYLSSDMSLE